jgi:hypothetical protein
MQLQSFFPSSCFRLTHRALHLQITGMHAGTVPTPHAASSSSKRSRMSTNVERSVAELVDGVEVDEEEEKLRNELVDEFCSEQEDCTHENSEDDAVTTTFTGETRAVSNEGYSLCSRYEDISGKHSPTPDESYTPPGRARLSSNLRTVVGHAQTLETTPSSVDCKGNLELQSAYMYSLHCTVFLHPILETQQETLYMSEFREPK